MDGIQIEFLVGLFLTGTAVSGAFSTPKIEVVRLIIGIVLMLMAIFGFNLLGLKVR